MENVMLDCETLSTAADAAILSIGAVSFDENGLKTEFYRNINVQTCIDKGLCVDGSTFYWWLEQNDDARKQLLKDQVGLKDARKDLIEWWPDGNVQVWSNGASFDIPILESVYRAFGARTPWEFWMARCFRTMRASFPTIDLKFDGTHHKALDDAKWQANYLIQLVDENMLDDVL